MLTEARDLLAVARLDKLLSQAREEFARRAMAGEAMRPEQAAAAETAALQEVMRSYYSAEARRYFRPGERLSDPQDFESRAHGQRLAEQGVIQAHRTLLALPVVGDPRWDAGEGAD